MKVSAFFRFTILLLLLTFGSRPSYTMDMVSADEGKNQDALHFQTRQNSEEDKSSLEVGLSSSIQVYDWYLFSFLDMKTLIAFSQSDHFYRELLYRPKLKHFLGVPEYVFPLRDARSLATLLKKIAIDERFLYGDIFMDNSLALHPREEETNIFKDKNNKIITHCLKESKKWYYSQNFRLLDGHEYWDEIASRHGEELTSGVYKKLETFYELMRRNPLAKHISATVILGIFVWGAYDLYTNYELSNYQYGYYVDSNNCIVYYAKARNPVFGGYHEHRSIPCCPENTGQEMNYKSDFDKDQIYAHLTDQLWFPMLLSYLHVPALILLILRWFMKFFLI